jgi:5-formyltetrahydrofolate cyclo-ligase
MSHSRTEILRHQGLANRRALDPHSRTRFSLDISRQFLRSRHFLSSHIIACYFATQDEVDTSVIFERAWRADKTICVPVLAGPGRMQFAQVSRNTRLRRNRFGIWEPVTVNGISPSEIDVVVTPLAVFDADGNRIGMGGGYYDRYFRFLANARQWVRPKLVGVAFECQRAKKIATNPWDIRLYKTITENS